MLGACKQTKTYDFTNKADKMAQQHENIKISYTDLATSEIIKNDMKKRKADKTEKLSILGSIKSGFYDGIKGSSSNAVKALLTIVLACGASITFGASSIWSFNESTGTYSADVSCRTMSFTLMAKAESKAEAQSSFDKTLKSLKVQNCNIYIESI